MSKITPPPAMTDEQVNNTWGAFDGPYYAVARAIEAARDKQWLEMLAQQEPVAYVVEGFDGDKLYAHQLYFTLNEARKTASVFAQHYPVVNTRQLYTAPVAQQSDHFPDAGKMIQAVPEGYKLVPVEPTDMMEAEAENAYERQGSPFPDWKSAYRAMLDAAPEQPAPVPRITDAMVKAYLDANTAYWRRQDELPKPPTKWINGTPQEATREGLAAALAQQPTPAPLTDEKLWARWEQVGMSEEETRLVVIQREPTAHEKRTANWFQVGVHEVERDHGTTKEKKQ